MQIAIMLMGGLIGVLLLRIYHAYKMEKNHNEQIKELLKHIEDREALINAQWGLIESHRKKIDELCKL